MKPSSLIIRSKREIPGFISQDIKNRKKGSSVTMISKTKIGLVKRIANCYNFTGMRETFPRSVRDIGKFTVPELSFRTANLLRANSIRL